MNTQTKQKGVFKGKRRRAKFSRYVKGRDRKQQPASTARSGNTTNAARANRPGPRVKPSVDSLKTLLANEKRTTRRLKAKAAKLSSTVETTEKATQRLLKKNEALSSSIHSKNATVREMKKKMIASRKQSMDAIQSARKEVCAIQEEAHKIEKTKDHRMNEMQKKHSKELARNEKQQEAKMLAFVRNKEREFTKKEVSLEGRMASIKTEMTKEHVKELKAMGKEYQTKVEVSQITSIFSVLLPNTYLMVLDAFAHLYRTQLRSIAGVCGSRV